MVKTKKGCFTNAGLSLLIGILSILLAFLTGRDVLRKEFEEFMLGNADFSSALFTTINSIVSLPLWAFFLLMVFASLGVVWLSVSLYNQLLRKGELIILDAHYILENNSMEVEVTNSLRENVHDGKLTLEVNNINLLGKQYSDFEAGEKKLLRVNFSYRGKIRSRDFAEGEILLLP
jgi:hypothetical protein